MKKFKFKFQSVESVRKIKEQQALRELALAQQKLQHEKNKKEGLLSVLESSLLKREKLNQEIVSPTPYEVLNQFIAGTKQRMMQSDQAIAKASRALEKVISSYLQARRQTRVMETLREKEYQEYKKRKNKLENKGEDEIYTTRFRLRQEEL